MRTKFLGIILFWAISAQLNAFTLTGHVTDVKRQPISYASVYLANHPQVGTMTDKDGRFELETNYQSDSVIFTFIGYEKVAVAVAQFLPNKQLRITLKEQPMQLEAVVVSAQGNKRQQRKALKELLAKIQKQLHIDIPETARKYRVVSRFSVYNEGELAGFDELVGNLVELPYLRDSHKHDSLQIKAEYTRFFLNNEIDSGLRNFDQSLLKKKEKRQLKKVDFSQSEQVHKILWSQDITQWFDDRYKNVSNWQITERDSQSQILTHTDTYNLPGILNATITTSLYFDAQLHLTRFEQTMKANANIPFGYKLSEAQLAALKILTIGSDNDDLEKFRLKTLVAYVKRNMLFHQQDGQTVVSEKNWVGDIKGTDKNGQAIKFNQKTNINVLSVQTKGVCPYTQQQIDSKAQRTQIYTK